MPTRFLLVDDHALLREGLALARARVTEQVEVLEAGSCEQALELLATAPDLDMVVLDMQLPGRSRLDALAALRARLPRVPFVVLSAETSTDLVHAVLRAGARGYVTKSSSTDILVGALKLVFAGGVYVPPIVLAPPPPEEHEVQLTPRQEQVLAELARGAGTEAIAATLGLAEATVRVHIATILRALRVDSREQAARTALAQRLRDRASAADAATPGAGSGAGAAARGGSA
ncbi:MAG: response regulator transcription factor [Myxococcota bacterium]